VVVAACAVQKFCYDVSGVLVGSDSFLYLITLANAVSNINEDGAETPKHVGEFVI
jgi:hypothetical protein